MLAVPSAHKLSNGHHDSSAASTLTLVRTRSTNLILRPLNAILDLSVRRLSDFSVFCMLYMLPSGCVCMEVLRFDLRCMTGWRMIYMSDGWTETLASWSAMGAIVIVLIYDVCTRWQRLAHFVLRCLSNDQLTKTLCCPPLRSEPPELFLSSA
jgi:hypothetical protein